MEAFVDGIIIWENPEWPEIFVKCENGKVIKLDVNDNFTPAFSGALGKEVEIEGKAYFKNGEVMVYAEQISVQRKTTHPPFCDIYTTRK